MEVAFAAKGFKALEKLWDVEPCVHLSLHDDLHSARTDTMKPEIIPGMPHEKLRQIEKVHKDTRCNMQLIQVETEKNRTHGHVGEKGNSKD